MANLNFFPKNLKFFLKNLKFPFRGLFPFSSAKLRISPESLRTLFAGAKVRNRIGSFGTNHELHEFHELVFVETKAVAFLE